MDFLPLNKNGRHVYIGVFRRAGAGIIDTLVLVPFSVAFYYLESLSIGVAIVLAVVASGLYAGYAVVCHACFGATVGKGLMHIRVTQPDGARITWRHAVLRSSPFLVFALLLAIAQIVALLQVDTAAYSAASWLERNRHVVPHLPPWHTVVTVSLNAWIVIECVVLLLNTRQRAIHDFIAGTVVIHRDFSVPYQDALRAKRRMPA
ncbi:MAG: RDD family protein [Pseudomonadota bacterium]